MAKKKKSIEQMIGEIIQDRLEIELHKQVRKIRKAVVKQRKKTSDQLREVKALPDPSIVDAEVVGECEENEVASGNVEGTEQSRD